MDDTGPEITDTREEEDLPPYSLQLQLAASIVDRLIERNGGREVADSFWDDDVFDSLDEGDEYLDPELWDPDEETLPEALGSGANGPGRVGYSDLWRAEDQR
jgi:hypothetical protein